MARKRDDFNFDDWVKDIESHPAFMQKSSNSGEVSDAMAALQAMKYEDEEDPENNARSYKEDGNKNFQMKKYRWAVDCYTEGIKQMCANAELNAILYANRSAANCRLGNYRSAFKDCFIALKFSPHHEKATLRGADCLLKLEEYGRLIDWCDEAINVKGIATTHLSDLKSKAVQMKKISDRDRRKLELQLEKDQKQTEALVNAILSRGIKIEGMSECQNMDEMRSLFQVSMPGDQSVKAVSLNPDGILVWPVMLLYPEFDQSDFIQEFSEVDTFQAHLEEMLVSSRPHWDSVGQYANLQDIIICFTDPHDESAARSFSVNSTLQQILSDKKYSLKGGIPCFIVLSRLSSFYEVYCKRVEILAL